MTTKSPCCNFRLFTCSLALLQLLDEWIQNMCSARQWRPLFRLHWNHYPVQVTQSTSRSTSFIAHRWLYSVIRLDSMRTGNIATRPAAFWRYGTLYQYLPQNKVHKLHWTATCAIYLLPTDMYDACLSQTWSSGGGGGSFVEINVSEFSFVNNAGSDIFTFGTWRILQHGGRRH